MYIVHCAQYSSHISRQIRHHKAGTFMHRRSSGPLLLLSLIHSGRSLLGLLGRSQAACPVSFVTMRLSIDMCRNINNELELGRSRIYYLDLKITWSVYDNSSQSEGVWGPSTVPDFVVSAQATSPVSTPYNSQISISSFPVLELSRNIRSIQDSIPTILRNKSSWVTPLEPIVT